MSSATPHQTTYPANPAAASAASAIPARTEAPAPTKKAMQKVNAIKRAICAFYEMRLPCKR